MLWSFAFRVIILLSISLLSRAGASAQVFTLEVPPVDPATISSTRSFLLETHGDAAGNALYVIEHQALDQAAGNFALAGRQWLLVSASGRLLASRDFRNGSGFPIKIVFFSLQRILARVDQGNGVTIAAFGRNLRFSGEVLRRESRRNTVVQLAHEASQVLPARFFDVTDTADDKLVRIRRFDSTELASGAE